MFPKPTPAHPSSPPQLPPPLNGRNLRVIMVSLTTPHQPLSSPQLTPPLHGRTLQVSSGSLIQPSSNPHPTLTYHLPLTPTHPSRRREPYPPPPPPSTTQQQQPPLPHPPPQPYTQPISNTFPPDYEKRQPWNDVTRKKHYTPIGSSFKLNRPANPHLDSEDHPLH